MIPSDTPKNINGLSEVFALYDGFILDLWGVVHDGVAPFPDTLTTLAALKKANKKVWLLSNAPRRVYMVSEKLSEMGITPDMYGGLLTSGEACWQALGHAKLVAETSWPKHDPALTASNSVTLPIQVNGKRRGEITMAKDAEPAAVEAAALADEGVIRALEGKTPKKVIVVPNRIVNIVV